MTNIPLLHMENPLNAIWQFICDLLIFFIKTIYYTLESIYYTVLPQRFRKMKFAIFTTERCLADGVFHAACGAYTVVLAAKHYSVPVIDISGQVVLITGGGGGVGRLLALNFAKLNARVVIWDINPEAIKTTVDLLVQNGYTCKGYVVDIADREQVYTRAAQVLNDVGNVEILCNNAGVVCCRPFWDLPDRVIQNTYNINIISHYWTVKAFLPHMMQNNRGHIVTVGSVTGMLGTYGCCDYSATKFACIGFHESLFTDLKAHGYNGINMTLICPYYINTGMFSGVRPRMLPMLEPQYVADCIVDALRKNEVWCVLPNSIRMMTPLKCLLPAKVCWELMSRVIRGPESMMMFRGRGKVAAG